MKMSKITIAVTDMDAMVTFYNRVFDCDLNAIPGTPFFAGTLLDTALLFCPNSIAEVNAEKNRIQFDIVIDNMDMTIEAVTDAGGSLYDDRTESDDSIIQGIKDPDDNSFVLIQQK